MSTTHCNADESEHVPLEEREFVEQPCIHIHTGNGERLVPVEEVEQLLRDMALEIQEGYDSHESTLVFIRPADEFDSDGENPLDTIN